MKEASSDGATDDSPQTTLPEGFAVSVRGPYGEERATQIGHLVWACVREISRHINLNGLDGVTIATDYNQALLDLDRGYVTSHRLTPSDGFAIGVAMTPSIMRDGRVKSHIILNAWIAEALEDGDHENFNFALHTLAHECAHVEITQYFDTAFPGVLLQRRYDDAHDAFRWQIIQACWDEYAATNISANFGEDPTAGYEETFILLLNKTRPKANDLIKAYRLHGSVDQIIG